MRIIAKSTLVEFWGKHPQFRVHLQSWYIVAKAAVWTTPADILADFPKASIIGKNRAVFRKGNDYRLVVEINFAYGVVYIRFVGTHDAYDAIDPATV
ncbi:MAG: type II toxin-antitoxin system HigB family toxin [Bacteroidota bacterium]